MGLYLSSFPDSDDHYVALLGEWSERTAGVVHVVGGSLYAGTVHMYKQDTSNGTWGDLRAIYKCKLAMLCDRPVL